MSTYLAYGARMLDDEGKCGFDTPEFRQALETFTSAYKKGVTHPDAPSMAGDTLPPRLPDGNFAMTSDSPNIDKDIENERPAWADKVEDRDGPGRVRRDRAGFLGGWPLILWDQSEVKDAAAKWIMYATRPEGALRQITEVSGAIPGSIKLAAEAPWNGAPYRALRRAAAGGPALPVSGPGDRADGPARGRHHPEGDPGGGARPGDCRPGDDAALRRHQRGPRALARRPARGGRPAAFPTADRDMASIETADGVTTAAPDGERGERLLPYVIVAPAVVVAFLIAVVPLAYGFWLSFQDWYLLRSPTPAWGGLINYVAALQRRARSGAPSCARWPGPSAPSSSRSRSACRWRCSSTARRPVSRARVGADPDALGDAVHRRSATAGGSSSTARSAPSTTRCRRSASPASRRSSTTRALRCR